MDRPTGYPPPQGWPLQQLYTQQRGNILYIGYLLSIRGEGENRECLTELLGCVKLS